MPSPGWFDAQGYLSRKLSQMRETDSSYTLEQLTAAFVQAGFKGDEGLYAHFVLYGQYEEIAPNDFFDAGQYYSNKAAQTFGTDSPTAAQILQVEATLQSSGFNAWSHYVSYGADEGINPSDKFDGAAYKALKLDQMRATDSTATMASLEAALSASGMSPLEHYLMYGCNEGFVTDESLLAFNGSSQPSDWTQPENPSGLGREYYLGNSVEILAGTSGNDVFHAVAGALQTGDVIDGGAGVDVLVLHGEANIGNFASAAIRGIEQVQAHGGAARATLDISGNTDVQEAWSMDRDASVIRAGLGQVAGFYGKHFSVMKAAFNAPGYNDAATVKLDSVVSTKGLNVEGVENLTLQVSGSNVLLEDDTPGGVYGNSLQTLFITGDAGASLKIEETTARTIDASAFSGSLHIELTDDYASTVIGSWGNDVIVSEGSADILAGGGGNDVFVFDDDLDGPFSSWALYSRVAVITDFSAGDAINVAEVERGIYGFAAVSSLYVSSEADLIAKVNAHLSGGEKSVQAVYYNGDTYLAVNGDRYDTDDDVVVRLSGIHDASTLVVENSIIAKM